MRRIVLAGGCFWGVQGYFKQLRGIISTSVGYANGDTINPKYEDLKQGRATHVEAVDITYDEQLISLVTILDHLFRFIDPTSLNKQGGDKGIQYRTGVYYIDEIDRKTINQYIKEVQYKYKRPIVVEVEKLDQYFLAEDYHQDYLDKNPTGYCHINFGLIHANEKK